ncbi:NAD(P)H-binding protein [Microbacterium sp. LMI1-1-1.1]|uniref:NAD(P)H-binding protein n=1 Tax=Microbacterium sp. LMI1-1-1.1 TaxID=3135223 RepID=UPI0034650B7E
MSNPEHELTLVVGGTGKTGAKVVERLTSSGTPVRIATRSSSPAFDWNAQETWTAVTDDVARAYVVHPGAGGLEDQEQIAAFIAHLRNSGVKRVVLLSVYGPDSVAEEAVVRSGMEYTIVRPGWFNQNFSEDFFLNFRESIQAGRLELPFGSTRFAFVDVDDIADVAVAALTGAAHNGKSYDLTGPRQMTFEEATGEIARATGREIPYTNLSPNDYAALLVSRGMSVEEAQGFAAASDAPDEQLRNGVQEALGRPATDFGDYAARTAKTGVWDAR